MLLSIVIPVYNVEDFLKDCINSIYNSPLDLLDFEVIAVNDGSTDNSLPILLEYKKKYSNFFLIDQVNHGVSFARNRALEIAKGEYIFFLDSDDYFKKDALNNLMQVLKNDRNSTIFLFDSIYNNTIETVKIDDFLSAYYFSFVVWKICIKNSFIKEQNLKFAEGFIIEDGIFILEAILKSDSVSILNLDLVKYVTNRNSYTREFTNESKNKLMTNSFVFVINKYQELTEIHKNKLSSKSIFNLNVRRESFIFFFITRMIRYKYSNKTIEEYISKIVFEKFNHFPSLVYNKLHYKLLAKIIENKMSRHLLNSIYRTVIRSKI